MGFSLSVAFATIAVSVFIIIEIFTGGLLPSVSDVNDSWKATKDRRADLANSQINITGIIDGQSKALWWNTSFKFRKLITIDHTKVEATQTNFPVLIDITDNDLRVFVQQSNGNDIVFVKSGITVKYNHQIESYDSSTGHLVAWVNVTSLSSTVNTLMYMYYGNATCANQQNPSGVWNGNYHGVWHLNESSGTLYDSTSYSNSGSSSGGPTYDVSGQIDGAMSFDGNNDHVSCGDPVSGSLDFGTGDVTVECWVKTSETRTRDIIAKYGHSDANARGYLLGIDSGYISAGLADGTGGPGFPPFYTTGGFTTINDNNWHYLVVTFDRDWDATLYVDGLYDGGGTIFDWSESISNTEYFYFARWNAYPSSYFQGTIDEARVSNNVRSAQWINTSFQNQNSTSTFYSLGSQTTLYLTIAVENTGSVNLRTDNFTILVNGTQYQCTCNRSYLFPLNTVRFYSTTQIASGPKHIKVIADNGVEDKYYYAFEIGP